MRDVELDRIDIELLDASEELQRARNAEATAIERAKRAALTALAAGTPFTEVNVAQALGVNRLTIRKWQGK